MDSNEFFHATCNLAKKMPRSQAMASDSSSSSGNQAAPEPDIGTNL
jgi:hypothetical protein